MKKKTLWITLIMLSLLLTACNSNTYKRDDSPGKVEKVSLDELCKKAEDKESFIALLTLSTCPDCSNFHQVLNTYLDDHNVILYEVVLDEEPTTRDENLDKIEKFITSFGNVPGIFYIEKGMQKSHLFAEDDNITEEMFEKWVKEFQLDKSNS